MFLVISADVKIPLSEFTLSYARSSGPGGQNVNKVNSKAILRWNLFASTLSIDLRGQIHRRLANQMSGDGDLVISSDRFRDQIRNREDCYEKFQKLLSEALTPIKPRKKTKPSRSSQNRAKEQKRKNSEKKSSRKFFRHDA